MTENTLRAFRLLEAMGPKARADLAVLIDAEQAERAQAQLAREVGQVPNRLAGVAHRMTGDVFSQAWG